MKIRKLPPLIWAFFLILTASCSSDEGQETTLTSDIVLRFVSQEVKTRTNGSVDPGTDQENTIDKLFIWFFAQDADDSASPLYFFETGSGLASKQEAIVTITEKMLGDAGMSIAGTYSLYVSANPTENAADVKTLTLGALKSHTFEASSRPGAAGSYFSMSGSVLKHDFSRVHTITIPLIRQAVKLGIKLVNETSETGWTINSVSIRSDQKTVALFEPIAGTPAPGSDTFTGDLSVSTAATTNSPATYSAYIYENLSETPTVIEVNANIGGVARKYLAEIKPEGAVKLLRNSACMVTLRLKDAEVVTPTDMEVTINEWAPGGIPEIDIPGSYLAINTDIVNVLPGDGGSVNVNTDADVIHIDLTNAPGFYLQEHEGEAQINLTIDKDANSSSFSFHFNGGTNTNRPNGTVIISAGNIHKKLTLQKSNANLIFEIKSIVINGHTINENDDVPSDFWNDAEDEAIINITVNTNFQWYCRRIYGSKDPYMGDFMDNGEYVLYEGQTEMSLNTINLSNYREADYDLLFPGYVKLEFYINNAPDAAGVLIETFEFNVIR